VMGGGLEAASARRVGFGPLVPDPDGLFDLPAGFSYKIIARIGEVMDDGLRVPGLPDGMAAFEGPNGTTVVVCNHELSAGDIKRGPFGDDGRTMGPVRRRDLYDAGEDDSVPSPGGTTNIVYDTKRQQKLSQFLSLGGTLRNCAGGPTPWGTWLTCEETMVRAGEDGCLKDHGYVFEVPAVAEPSLASPRAIKAMGRFNHEAVCVDPRTSIVYLTEDRGDGLVYRFIPNTPRDMHGGGRLQAMAVRGRNGLDTRNWGGAAVELGATLETEWIDVEDIDAPEDDLRHRGFAAGAARFARGEGVIWTDDAAYIVCTDGGALKKGQIFRYEPSPYEGTVNESERPGRLSLFVEADDPEALDMPDNIGVAPWGDLVLCEDGGGVDYLVGVTPDGELYKLGRNARNSSELAGACFSPDGTTLFVNMQGFGLTLAVTGPWRS
jgi:secreted PhoX family phosphatase